MLKRHILMVKPFIWRFNMKSFDNIKQLLESNSGDIKHAKKKSLNILTDVEDKLGSANAILAGLEGYIESLELFYKENDDKSSQISVKYILADIRELKSKIDLIRVQSGPVHSIIKNIKRLKS